MCVDSEKEIPRPPHRMIMLIDFDTCSGCQSCVVACSMETAGVFSPTRSLITIQKREDLCLNVPVICEHCVDPPCLSNCPTEAITQDLDTGVVRVIHALCNGCKACKFVCPFGQETIKFHDGKAMLCNLCNGAPQCSKICQQKAIAFMPFTSAAMSKKWELAEKRKKMLLSMEVL